MAPQYLKNNHVTYYVITQVGVYAAQQWYVITSDVTWDSRTAGITNKLPDGGVKQVMSIPVLTYITFMIVHETNFFLFDGFIYFQHDADSLSSEGV